MSTQNESSQLTFIVLWGGLALLAATVFAFLPEEGTSDHRVGQNIAPAASLSAASSVSPDTLQGALQGGLSQTNLD